MDYKKIKEWCDIKIELNDSWTQGKIIYLDDNGNKIREEIIDGRDI